MCRIYFIAKVGLKFVVLLQRRRTDCVLNYNRRVKSARLKRLSFLNKTDI